MGEVYADVASGEALACRYVPSVAGAEAGMGRDQLRFLGHGTGLCLDEWPPIARTVTKPLAEGMSIALEPKIAVPGIGMAGLEHTCLLTRQKAEILTGSRLSILALKN